jgi:signal transduction histidine kinase/CheY-like chemotaxis protein
MKRILILVYSTFLIILLVNFIYYKSLYNNQIDYINKLLDKQVHTLGAVVDSTNNSFATDLTGILFNENLSQFFNDNQVQFAAKEKMKFFFSKYNNLITGIKFYDTNKNEFTLKRDPVSGEWLEQPFILHEQDIVYDKERIISENQHYNYYLPVLKDGITTGNIVVTFDYRKYFHALFSEFHLKDYQWQWVVSDSGEIIYDNQNNTTYSQIDKITRNISTGSVANMLHTASVNGKSFEVVSSYYAIQLLQKEMSLVFSAPTTFFKKYLVWHSLFIVLITLALIQVIIFFFRKYLLSQKAETEKLRNSEKMLLKLIEEMPVGVIVHNKNREILKANHVAAEQYSFASEAEMKGTIFPESALPGQSDYYSKNLGSYFNPDQVIILKKDEGEIILHRNSIPVVFQEEEATMVILIDVTLLESARKQEVRANEAKTDFLARMSYEIRTPLNGIIGMTDILKKFHLTPEIKETVWLLHRSTEVLLSIINDILDFSRIESGQMILDENPFNLSDEIAYCTELAQTNIRSANLVLNVSIADDVPESIIGDAFRLRQVITNLLNHSIKNTESGEIRLTCSLKSNISGIVILHFLLLDTGRSYDKASLKKIFGNFLQIESQKVKSVDSEFGTILSKQLVSLMGGELTAECPSGISGDHGTKISFSIRTYSNDRLKKELDLQNITTFDKVRTLVITGDQNRDEEILGALHQFGLNISVTTFQRSTINQIKANLNFTDERYKLVVLFDDELFNAFEAARSIWENKLSSEFIMIMISATDKRGNYLSCITMGIDHYLVKPFDGDELLSTIKSSFPFIADKASAVEISSARTDISILVIEDNKMNQKVIGSLLNILGYTFDLADDGYNGYLLAKDKKYDLIFMDLIMPEMDGFESAQRILKFDKSVIIVAFTADNMPETKRKAELSGIRDFVSKPVRLDELKKLFIKYFRK